MQNIAIKRTANIPMRVVGPVTIISDDCSGVIPLPLATFESPLWSSTHRGAKICTAAGGIVAAVLDERMTRSVLLEASSLLVLEQVCVTLQSLSGQLQELISEYSQYTKLLAINSEIVGSLLFVRLEYSTGDASGHNMVTLASDKIINWLLANFSELRYVSISGNYCCDKKVSAVNGILGRGKRVAAEVVISHKLCQKLLRTTPSKIVELNVKKNLVGNIVAGGLRTANAHFANMLLAIYLATGQDAANIIEGSQGIVYAEIRNDDLYFSVTLPNIIVGTVGNGKHHDFVAENLKLLGCLEPRAISQNARRLSVIVAAAVLCGELSLLAAQTNQGELMRSHIALERATTKVDG